TDDTSDPARKMRHRDRKVRRNRSDQRQALKQLSREDHHEPQQAEQDSAPHEQPAKNVDMYAHVMRLLLGRLNGRHDFAAAFAAEASDFFDVISTIRAKH